MFSTNHKDIGVLYFIISVWGGLIGLSLSVLIRFNLRTPYFVFSGEFYNSIVTLHALFMIFFFCNANDGWRFWKFYYSFTL